MIQYLALVAAPFLLSSATVTGSDVPVTCGKTNALQQLISNRPPRLGSPLRPGPTICRRGPNVQIIKDDGNYVIDEAGGFPRSSRAVEAGPSRCMVHCDCTGNRWCSTNDPSWHRYAPAVRPAGFCS